MQVAYIKKMEKLESPRRARRRTRLDELVLEVGSAAQLARETEIPKSHISAMQAGKRGLGDDLVKKLETRYRKHNREEITKRQQSGQWFVLAVVASTLCFAGYAIYAGQTALVLDVLKIVVGFAGGMGFQAYRTYKKNEADDD